MTSNDERRAAWLAKVKASQAELQQAEVDLPEVPAEVTDVLLMLDMEIAHLEGTAQAEEPDAAAEPPQAE